MAEAEEEVFVVTSSGSGHLFPCIELCNHIASRNYKTTLVLPSNLSPFVPSSFLRRHPLLGITEIAPVPGGPSKSGSDPNHEQALGLDLEACLSRRSSGPNSSRPLCAIIDFQMGSIKHIFWKFNVAVISLFTFGACPAAMEWGAWKSEAGNINSGDVCTIPGLPNELYVTYSDLKRQRRDPPRAGGPASAGSKPVQPPGSRGSGPPKPGDQPPWVPLIEGSIALMFNTSDDLERPFIDYVANQMGMPVWGVGPLLPEQYWQSSDCLIRDTGIRQPKRHTNCSEDEVIQWLDSKPPGSVLYVSFGSEVVPTTDECSQLAGALEDSTCPFIWVVQPQSGLPDYGLEAKVGDRGLIIKGWAPQLLILSHPSTGGFLSHCGWNSTVEAIGKGVPFLAWPIRGDQIYNAKLVVNHLKVGYMAWAEDSLEKVRKEDILKGIERLMGDEMVHKRAAMLGAKFDSGFPSSSEVGLDAFRDFIGKKAA